MDYVKSQVGQQLVRGHEMLFGFAHEAHDDVCCQCHLGHPLSNAGQEAAVLVCGVPPCHSLESEIVAGLHRQFDVLADLVQFGYGFDDPIAHVVGVGGQKPYSLQVLHLVDCIQQIGQIRPVRQITAVGVHILP